MTLTSTDAALSYYARHSCALFPIPAGQKSPVGIVESFAKDHSTAQAAHNCCLSAILIEREAEYQADIERRIAGLPLNLFSQAAE